MRSWQIVVASLLSVGACGDSSETPDAGAGDAGGSVDGGGRSDASAELDAAVLDAAVELDAAVIDAAAAVDAALDASVAPDASSPRVFAGLVPDAPSSWTLLPDALGQVGLEAGHRACVVAGGDHVCDYEEVRVAETRGELGEIPTGTTAWLQRTTTVTVDGMESPPGQGGNCVDWTFDGNHLADGEYITFDAPGVPTYHFDPDTTFDGLPGSEHVTGTDFPCGGVLRAILCCHAAP